MFVVDITFVDAPGLGTKLCRHKQETNACLPKSKYLCPSCKIRKEREGKGKGRKGRFGKVWEGLGREGKVWEGLGREGLGREGKVWEGLGREGLGREGKGREGKGWTYIHTETINRSKEV